MTDKTIYKPDYENSWALIIGINKYEKVSPLGYACNDANAIAEILTKRFQFPASNTILLTDKKATRDRIRGAYLDFNKIVQPDDRLLVFFAGHGYTVSGRRGEVGYLVPVDGDPENLATLVRWDDLTRNADLIPAKHILFVMDTCYGGLAVTRCTLPGSMRFMKDMLQRFSRQVLTAGKADEVVADVGGPRAGHSIFTGHLLEALEGKAATPEGILTANGVMAYVYDKVATDHNSNQTPHYGFIDGDGDFIFDVSVLKSNTEDPEIDSDVLFENPPVSNVPELVESERSIGEVVKEYLSDKKYLISLEDIAREEVRNVLEKTREENFPVRTPDVTVDEFTNRLKSYETIIKDLQTLVVLLSKWGTEEYVEILENIFARVGDFDTMLSGKSIWIGLRWYPIELLLYSAGIASLSSNNYEKLAKVFNVNVVSRYGGGITHEIIVPTVDEMNKLHVYPYFKNITGHERNYVPKSEYIFKVLQPPLEDLLLLGRRYELLFDKFEVLYALVFADLTFKENRHIWGPPGRFAWKYSRFGIRTEENPFLDLIAQAKAMSEDWPPIKFGLFGGSYERFLKIANGYEEFLNRLRWF